MKIKKCSKFVCNLHDKKNCCSHKSFKTSKSYGLVFKKMYKVMKLNQKAWMKPYIYMNTKLRKEAENEFEKYFFKLTNNSIFGKFMANIRKHSL